MVCEESYFAASIRSEIRRIIRKWNDLAQPLPLVLNKDRPSDSPKYLVKFQMQAEIPPMGKGLRYRAKNLILPEERLQDLVYDFARAVWHFRDWLLRWQKVTKAQIDPFKHAKQCEELLIAGDLINKKKHGENRNQSKRDPWLSLVYFDISKSGVVEFWYNGVFKQGILFVTNLNAIHYWINIYEGDGSGLPGDESVQENLTLIGDAADVLLRGFLHWIPLLRKSRVLVPGEPESDGLIELLREAGASWK